MTSARRMTYGWKYCTKIRYPDALFHQTCWFLWFSNDWLFWLSCLFFKISYSNKNQHSIYNFLFNASIDRTLKFTEEILNFDLSRCDLSMQYQIALSFECIVLKVESTCIKYWALWGFLKKSEIIPHFKGINSKIYHFSLKGIKAK